MSKTRKIMTYVMLGMMILSNFQNRLYAEGEEWTNTEVSSITSVNSPDFVWDYGLSSTSSDEENSNNEWENLSWVSATLWNAGETNIEGDTKENIWWDSENQWVSDEQDKIDDEKSEKSSDTSNSSSDSHSSDTENSSDPEETETNNENTENNEENSNTILNSNKTLWWVKRTLKSTNAPLRGTSNFGTITISKPAGYTGVGPDSFVIMDRNLGATSNDITSEDSYGYHYQWGNNYGFPHNEGITTLPTKVDTSSYGPSNPYSSDTFITKYANWSSVLNNNLWWWMSDSENNNRGLDDIETTAPDRQWPCPSWYHVPSGWEWKKLIEYWCLSNSDKCGVDMGNKFQQDLLLPFAGYYEYQYVFFLSSGENGYYWSSSPFFSYDILASTFYINSSNATYGNSARANGNSIRCFKNPSVSNSATINLSATPGGSFFKTGENILYTVRSGSFDKEIDISSYGDLLRIENYGTFYAEADQGYKFSGWNNTCGSTLTDDCSIVAEFVQNSATINFSATPGGYFFKSGYYTSRTERSESFDKGTSIWSSYNGLGIGYSEFYAQADQWYEFSGWINTCGTTLTDDCSIVAEFVKNGYTINFSATTWGSVFKSGSYTSPTEQPWFFPMGTRISTYYSTLTVWYTEFFAHADQWYAFSGWINTCGTTLTDDCSIVAEFVKNEYLISLSATTGGSFYFKTGSYASLTERAWSVNKGAYISINNNNLILGYYDPIIAQADQWYEFSGWNNTCGETLTDDCTIIAEFTKKRYLVTWEHPDGYSLSESELEYWTVPVYTWTIPTKATVAGHKYTFKGWTDGTNHYNKNTSLPAITEDTTFTAEFEDTILTYTIRFIDNGTVLQNSILEYGVIPQYNGVTPIKEGATFSGWNPQITAVDWDKDYIAVFDPCTPCNAGTGATCTLSVENNQCTYTTSCIDGYEVAKNAWKYNPTCKPLSYEIHYKLNGGENHPQNPDTYTIENETITLANPTRVGHEFSMWKEGNIIPAWSTGEKTFEALWDVNQYQLTFNPDNGENTIVIIGDYNSDIPSIEEPTKSGNTFLGWDKTVPTKMPANNDMFTALWNPCTPCDAWTWATCTLSVENNQCTYTTSCKEWYYKLTGTGTITPTCTPLLWTVTYHLNDNGENKATNNPWNIETYTVEDSDFTLLPPERKGYKFKGWLNEQWAIIETIVVSENKDRNLTAKWEANKIHITLDKDGGTWGTDELWYLYEIPTFYADVNLQHQLSGIVRPKKVGYDFQDYFSEEKQERYLSYTDNSGNIIEFADDLHLDIDQNATLKARWTPKIIHVTLDPNGGTGGTSDFYFSFNEKKYYTDEDLEHLISKIVKPTREGYTFQDYYSEEIGERFVAYQKGNQRIELDTPEEDSYYKISHDLTLKARRKENGKTQSTHSSWGGWSSGGRKLVKDDCPDWDFSDSYYDGKCSNDTKEEKSDDTREEGKTEWTHGSADRTKEEIDIFERASKKGLTSMDTIESFAWRRSLTRAEMAKIISIFATKFMDKKETSDSACKDFEDIKNITSDLHDYIIESCNLGIMGRTASGIWVLKTFFPDDEVTKAEAVTIISRVFWNHQYKNKTDQKRYEWHLKHLIEIGVISDDSDIENPFSRHNYYGALKKLHTLDL